MQRPWAAATLETEATATIAMAAAIRREFVIQKPGASRDLNEEPPLILLKV